MANARAGDKKTAKEEAKQHQAQAAAEATARRNKKRKDKGSMQMYLAIASCVGLVIFGIFLAASNPGGAKTLSPSRSVNDASFVSQVTSASEGNFTASPSKFFDNWQLDQIKYSLGGISSTISSMVGMAGAVQVCPGDEDIEGGALPSAFDARTEWPECITEVRDSGNCSSSYAMAAATSLAARFCVADNSKYAGLRLSPQQVLSCDTASRGCRGGGVDSVFAYIERRGLYPDECLSYAGAAKAKCKTDCDETKKHKIIKYCVLGNRKSIKRELQSRGPVVLPLFLMDDLLVYSGGVYQPTELARPVPSKDGKQMSTAVVLHGWGISQGAAYWIIEGSWGSSWGEEGYARVAMSAGLLDSYAVVSYPATAEAIAAAEKLKDEEAVRKEEAKRERAARDERIKEAQRLRKEAEAARRAEAGDDADFEEEIDLDTEFEEEQEEEIDMDSEM